jgi:beta-mannosidase
MRKIDLTGDWEIYKEGLKRNYAAYVPGCIHGSLLDAGVIADPFSGDNLLVAHELLRSGWRYEKVFVAEDLSEYNRVVLHFEGIISAADIRVNGKRAGCVDSCFMPVDLDVGSLVKAGKNRLSVKFKALPESHSATDDQSQSYKQFCEQSFGLWGDVSLQAHSTVRITDLQIDTLLKTSNAAEVALAIESEAYADISGVELLARICYKGNILSEERLPYKNVRQKLRLEVKNPQLWWPASMGDQPLYEVTIDILKNRTCLEHVSRRIGLRTFELREEKSGKLKIKRFYVNGKLMIIKGAEWIPPDIFIARPTRVEYAHLVKSTVIANINLLRVSGAGIYENDFFYNLCDEYGICVWQDVLPDAEDRCAASAMRCALQRLRHHPSLVVWYGGDLPQWLCSELSHDPGLTGTHLIWVNQKPESVILINYGDDCPAIVGAPAPRETHRFLELPHRNLGDPVCRLHHSSSDDIKNVFCAFVDNFRMPTTFDSMLWLSQIQQGVNLQRQVEESRMNDENYSGFIFRRLNDGWPCFSSSSLDYYGVWKALHYMVRRFYTPLFVCGRYDQQSCKVSFRAFNDYRTTFKGEICWSVSLMDGLIVQEGSRRISVNAESNARPFKVGVGDLIRRHGANRMIMWIYLLDEQGNKVSWNVVLFCRIYQLELQPARMRAEIRKHDENSYVITLTSQTPAMWAWVSLEGIDAVYSDNFFCMEPVKPFSVKIIPKHRIKLDEFRQRFRIGSLRDTWLDKANLMQLRASPKKK